MLLTLVAGLPFIFLGPWTVVLYLFHWWVISPVCGLPLYFAAFVLALVAHGAACAGGRRIQRSENLGRPLIAEPPSLHQEHPGRLHVFVYCLLLGMRSPPASWKGGWFRSSCHWPSGFSTAVRSCGGCCLGSVRRFRGMATYGVRSREASCRTSSRGSGQLREAEQVSLRPAPRPQSCHNCVHAPRFSVSLPHASVLAVRRCSTALTA